MSRVTERERNDSDWVREKVIEAAMREGEIIVSGAWLAQPVEGMDRVDVFKFDHSVPEDDDE